MVTTFLPYESFEESLSVLDNKRLGKQRVECFQILNAITKGEGGYYNHPATKMWVNNVNALKHYYNICLKEWKKRGFKNNMESMIIEGDIIMPWYIGWKHFHESHKASLYRKDTEYYKSLFPSLDQFYIERGYVWPSHHSEEALMIPDSQLDSYYTNKKPLFAKINIKGIKDKKDNYTVTILKAMCKERGLRGYSKLKKSELLDLLCLNHQS